MTELEIKTTTEIDMFSTKDKLIYIDKRWVSTESEIKELQHFSNALDEAYKTLNLNSLYTIKEALEGHIKKLGNCK